MERLARIDLGDLGRDGPVLEANVSGHLLGTGCGSGFPKVVDVNS